ncbi:MAG: hypothetical protein M1821_009607 [Bathelium mastoideum]|nr:MAG: hypothetical protein M1821_009607 [Bathelium mastoideum]KAI9688831.1 MAG: hypothetical protein M1822_001188 [Bathelium mastoideum]
MADPVDSTQEAPLAPPAADDSSAQLSHLIERADALYAKRSYAEAADLYSQATALQAEANGEMNPANADLLYAYGRCLYKVAVDKSDVLGDKVAGEKKKGHQTNGAPKKEAKRRENGEGSSAKGLIATTIEEGKDDGDRTAEEVVTAVVEEKDGFATDSKPQAADNKPFFQITGDENWDNSDDEDDDADGEAGEAQEAEEDDFANAYEILDVARVLLDRRLEELLQSYGKGKGTTENAEVRQAKERLADTHDLQAEISLENERFADAITDERASLKLKQELYAEDSELIAEAHYKLSLALEFASVTVEKDENGEPKAGQTGQVDETMRAEAVTEMEDAIESTKLRVIKEERQLTMLGEEERQASEARITEVKDIIEEMEQRLVELKNPTVSTDNVLGPAGAPDGSDPLRGILGAMLGESPAQQRARIEEASKNANDLTGLVKHRKKPKNDTAVVETATNGGSKRKAEVDDAADGLAGKKAKVEDAGAE